MISEVCVRSRSFIEKIITDKVVFEQPWALISIYRNPGSKLITEERAEILKECGCEHYLNLCFMDITPEEYDRLHKEYPNKTLYLFNEGQAKEIIQFIDKINNLLIPRLFVHCTAGISRSAAVGLFAIRYLNLNEPDFWKTHSWIAPNYHILDTLLTTSNMKKDYEHFWQYFTIDKKGIQ